MGICGSNPVNVQNSDVEDCERCPTVYELESEAANKRAKTERLYINMVLVEVRKSVFDVYNVGERLDMESSRRVWIAQHKGTGRRYAVTEVEIPPSRSAKAVRRIWEEFDRQGKLDHPNICRLHELYCSEERYFVVTDLCSGGDLLSHLETMGKSRYGEAELIRILRKIVGALAYGHEMGIPHGHLQLSTCLLEHTGPGANIMLVDFGRDLSDRLTGSSSSGELGGLCFMPPELKVNKSATFAGNMWSVGVITFMMLTGGAPFTGLTDETIKFKISMGKVSFKGRGWEERSAEAKDFVSRLLQKDPEKRMTAIEALDHPWLNPKPRSVEPLPVGILSSLEAFKNSCLLRRTALQMVAHRLETPSVAVAKNVFRSLDFKGRGYFTEDTLLQAVFAATKGPGRYHGPFITGPGHLGESTIDDTCGQDEVSAVVAGCSLGGKEEGVRDEEIKRQCRNIFLAMEEEGSSGRVYLNTFLGACLAGRPADESLSRVVFGQLATRKERGNPKTVGWEDMAEMFGAVRTRKEVEEDFHCAVHILSDTSVCSNAMPDPIWDGEELDANGNRRASAAGVPSPEDIRARTNTMMNQGLTYAEFYHLLASVPLPPSQPPPMSGSTLTPVYSSESLEHATEQPESSSSVTNDIVGMETGAPEGKGRDQGLSCGCSGGGCIDNEVLGSSIAPHVDEPTGLVEGKAANPAPNFARDGLGVKEDSSENMFIKVAVGGGKSEGVKYFAGSITAAPSPFEEPFFRAM